MTTTQWGSSVDLDQLCERLSRANKVLILTHAKPDGDAIGSTASIAFALESLGKQVQLAYIIPVSGRFKPMLKGLSVSYAQDGWTTQTFAGLIDADTILICDTGSRKQLAHAAEFVEQRAERAIILDHHANGDADLAATRYIDTDKPAAAEIAAEVCLKLLKLNSAKELDLKIATPIYMGLATDTGWFKHPSLRPSTLRLAADLLDAGVDHNALFLNLEFADPPTRLLLMQRAMERLTLLAEGTGAIMGLSLSDFEETGASPDETGGLVDIPKTVAQVRVSCLATETVSPEGKVVTKLSFRSKAGTEGGAIEVDVNELCATMGGGGHKHAAGARLEMPLNEAMPVVAKALEKALTR